MDHFQARRGQEQKKQAIELLCARTFSEDDAKHDQGRYLQRQYFVCARHGTGGQKKPKGLVWNRKIARKRMGCPCRLVVKSYPDTAVILGKYESHHNHDIGNANLRFTRISKDTKELIAGLLRTGVSPERILKALHGTAFDEEDHRPLDSTSDCLPLPRNIFIRLCDITRIQKELDAENIRLNRDDGKSTREWAEKLAKQNSLLGFKAVNDAPPPGSNLTCDTFSLMIQKPWQQRMYLLTTWLFCEPTQSAANSVIDKAEKEENRQDQVWQSMRKKHYSLLQQSSDIDSDSEDRPLAKKPRRSSKLSSLAEVESAYGRQRRSYLKSHSSSPTHSIRSANLFVPFHFSLVVIVDSFEAMAIGSVSIANVGRICKDGQS
ncbi:hypothetical protein BDP27DRAFT_1402045 [Rhodocollybia butyracea]|uniref:Uncharacterized protein n=1 Tax=Rhodocollybia butyracea TaxID=206335 RepID=A0A9P5U8X6_9AGAR|nr:hypothetical protein BDP27DRAFT_1402045 [Rhodocollybia butyracea]